MLEPSGNARDTARELETCRARVTELEKQVARYARVLEPLQHSERKFRHFYSGMRDGCATMDFEGRFLECNPAFERLMGYTIERLRERTFWELTPPGWHAREAQVIDQHIRKRGYSGLYEKEFIRRDGTVFPVELSAYLIRDPQGGPAGMWAVVRDITARKHAEDALRESELRYRALFENAPVGIVLASRAGRLLAHNAAVCQTTGYDDGELESMEAGELYGEPEVRAGLLDELSRDGQVRDREVQMRRKDGTVYLARLTIIPFRPGPEDVVLAVMEDITASRKAQEERARLLEQLHQARKMEAIGHLAGGIAHDFNNLVAVILGCVREIEPALSDGDGAREALDLIVAAAGEVSSLTASLRAFSQNLQTHKKPVNLGDCVQQCARLARRVLPDGVQFVVDVPGDCPLCVNADESQLQQVLMNLVINARDAMPEGGRLCVRVGPAETPAPCGAGGSTDPDGGYARLEVTDSGTGIPDEVRPRIFEPFFTTKAGSEGAGLGLAIVRRIVEDHGGYIELDGQAGCGSTFRVLLPRIAPQEASSPQVSGPGVPQGRGELIVVADDNPQVREITTSTLVKLGYETRHVRDGHELEKQAGGEPQRLRLIILAAELPPLGGVEHLRRARRQGLAAPAVLTAGTMTAGLEDRLDDETLLLRKPFQMGELGRLVARLLGATGEQPREEIVATLECGD